MKQTAKVLPFITFCLVLIAVTAWAAISIDQGRNPIVLSSTTASSQPITTDDVTIVGVLWFSPDTIGDLLAIQDKNGKELLELECGIADHSQLFDIPFDADGISIDDMDSGVVYIYTKPSSWW